MPDRSSNPRRATSGGPSAAADRGRDDARSPLSVRAEVEPVLTADAAVVLLRILRKAHDRQTVTDRGRSFTDDQAVA